MIIFGVSSHPPPPSPYKYNIQLGMNPIRPYPVMWFGDSLLLQRWKPIDFNLLLDETIEDALQLALAET